MPSTLFKEENLGELLHSLSHHSHGEQKQDQTDSIKENYNSDFPTSESGQTVSLAPPVAEGQSKQPGSPKSKKTRVLTDVNCLTVPTADVQKYRVDESAGSVKAADVSGSVSSAHTMTVLTHVALDDGTALPRRPSLSKFPGFAGIRPPAEEVCSSQASGEMFGGAAWQSLVTDLQPDADNVLTKFSVRAMVRKASRRQLPKGKVPLMVGVLESIDFQGTDASVMLRDPTGQIQGTLHREAVKDFSIELQTGAAMVLRQVSVISPSPWTHYLNITSGNIVAIYPAHGDRAPTVLPTCPEHPPVGQPCQEVMKHCVCAAERELLEAEKVALKSALHKLSQLGSPAHASAPRVNASVGSSTPSSLLFSNTSFQGVRGAVARPFTPPFYSQTTPWSAAGTGGFTFRKAACVPPQMRTPTPSYSSCGCGGWGISGANSSTPRGLRVSNSQQTAGTRSVKGSLVTGQSAKSSSSGGGSGWSSGHQPNSYRLQPPASGDAHCPPGVNQVSQTSVSAGSADSPRIPSSVVSGQSISSTFTTITNSVRLEALCLRSNNLYGNSNSQTSSEQSKWTLKRKMTEPAGQTKQGDVNANSEGKAP